jgi:cell division protease FtsH
LPNPQPPHKKLKKSSQARKPDRLVWVLFFMFLIFVVWQFANSARKDIPYSEFQKMLAEGKVSKVEVADDVIRIYDNSKPPKLFLTTPLRNVELEKELKGKPIEVKGIPHNRWSAELMLTWLLPIGLCVGFMVFLSRRVMGVGDTVMKFSKSKARRVGADHPVVTFRDVAGVDEAKQELAEIIDYLKEPAKYQRLGGKIPKGVLLVGPPGTGKTMIARAVAGEAGVPFFSMSGSDFVEMFVGVGAARVRDLFEQSKRQAPCIIFIDELDAVGRYRGAGVGGGHDEREQTLNQLLVEMDGFETRKGVIILAATNRPDVLDPALLRPGRFDRQVVIDAPDLRGRLEILQVHARDIPIAQGVSLERIAQRTPGFSGADLANVINEAALLAARRNKDQIETADLDEAVERVIAGPQRKSRVMSEKERRVVAYHEAGHALVAYSLTGSDPVAKISIIPRGVGALGYTLQLPTEDKYITTQTELQNKLAGLMGGRAAEEIVFGHLSTGAHNDLEKVSHLARRMVCEFGMNENLGPVTYGKKESAIFLGKDLGQEKNYSEHTAQMIDQEVQRLGSRAFETAKRILTERRRELDALAAELLLREVIEGTEIKSVLEKAVPPPRAVSANASEASTSA